LYADFGKKMKQSFDEKKDDGKTLKIDVKK